MNPLRMAWIEARALHRVLGFWLLGLLIAWLLLTRLQEPVFFRRRGVPFYWASVEAVLVITLALLPLIWRLGQGHAAALWTLRGARSHSGKIIASWLSIVGYGVLTGCIVGLALLPLGRTQTVFTWLVLTALVLHFLWPGWRSGRTLVDLLCVLQATAAGLLLSLAVTLHRARA